MGLVIEGFDVQLPQTNIVYVTVPGAEAFVGRLREKGVLCAATGADKIRLVTHLDVDDGGVAAAISAFVSCRGR
jgi:threonine aldolase